MCSPSLVKANPTAPRKAAVHAKPVHPTGDSVRRMENESIDGDAAASAPPQHEDPSHDTPLVEDELLVEEISIDGMCGVY